MSSRERILTAAAELFAQHGFRGTTTRRIAEHAGVNEVTIFRTFGSKERLISEAVHAHAAGADIPPLPEVPVHPEKEIAEWSSAQLIHLRRSRAMIRKCMGEVEERPDFGPEATNGPAAAGVQLHRYLQKLLERGLIRADVNQQAAIAMLLGACFSDAMGRDIMPQTFPQPAERAAHEYTRLFLAALGFVNGSAGSSTSNTAVSANNQHGNN